VAEAAAATKAEAEALRLNQPKPNILVAPSTRLLAAYNYPEVLFTTAQREIVRIRGRAVLFGLAVPLCVFFLGARHGKDAKPDFWRS